MKQVLTGILVCLCVLNTGLFVFWFNLVNVAVSTEEIPSYFYNSLSMNIMIMEFTFLLITVFIGVIGFFGYKGIKDNAERIAGEKAEEYLRENGKNLIRQEINKNQIMMIRPTLESQQNLNTPESSSSTQESGI